MADPRARAKEKALLWLMTHEDEARARNPNADYYGAIDRLRGDIMALREGQDAETEEGLGLSAEQQQEAADPERYAGTRSGVPMDPKLKAERVARQLGGAAGQTVLPDAIQESATEDFTPGTAGDEFSRLRAQEMAYSQNAAHPDRIEDSATGHAALYRPSVSPGGSALSRRPWEEPSIGRVREHLRPYMGDKADTVTEDSEEYKRVADFLYMRDYDRATREGYGVIRLKYAETPGIIDKIGYGAGKLSMGLGGLLAGFTNSATMGIADRVDRAIEGPDEASLSELEAQNPVMGTIGRFAGYLTPAGLPGKIFGATAKVGRGAVGKALGSEAAKGLGGRLLGGALGGGLGMALEGAGRDVAETAGTDEFLERMEALPETTGWRALAGGAVGSGVELAGAAFGGLARRLRARPGYSDMIGNAEANGVEMGAIGVREPPVVGELRTLGQGQGPVVGAARKAISGIPERDALVEPLAARIGSTDTLAAEASEPIANAAFQRQARALEIADRARATVYEQLKNQRVPFTPIYRRIVNAAKERSGGARGPWPFVSTKPLTWLKGVSEKLVVTEDAGAAETLARTNKGDVWPFQKFWGTFVGNAGNELDPVAKEFYAQLPEDVAAAIGEGNVGLAQKLGERLRVVTMPRKGTVQELDMIEPWVNDLAKVRTPSGVEPVDRLYRELLQDLYGVREQFPAKMPAELAEAAGIDASMAPVVRQPGGTAKQVKGYGAVKKAINRILRQASDAAREAGLPNRDLPGPDAEFVPVKGAEGKFIPWKERAIAELAKANPSMTPDEWSAAQKAIEGFTGRRPQDRAILAMARGTPAEPILERIARRNVIGDPTGALRSYGMPGSSARDAALDAELGATELGGLSLLNRLGGSRASILATLRDLEGRVALEKDTALRELMGPEAVRGYDASLAAEQLRAGTRNPEGRLAMRGGMVVPQLGALGTVAVQRLGDMAYPWLRALGSAPGEFPTPGRFQAPRLGSSLALRDRGMPVPATLAPSKERRRGARTQTGSKVGVPTRRSGGGP